jgi:ADP-ribose pyrophosphatase YjhB (NUDIX family)
MRVRQTARVVLLDPQDRLLLMKARPPSDPAGPAVWFLIGGGLEPGESLAEAAAREIVEETGLTDAQLGSLVWRGEAVIADAANAPVHFKESYFVARTGGGALSRDGWRAEEHALVDELRWWRLEELQGAGEMIYPEGLAELLADILAGRFAPEPLVIRTLEGPAPQRGQARPDRGRSRCERRSVRP